MRHIKLYARYITISIKSRMEYRFAFFVDLVVLVLVYSMGYLGVFIILSKFKTIQGWNFYEVILLYNMNLFAYALGSMFFSSMRWSDELVRLGTFDSMMVYPLNPFLCVVYRNFGSSYFAHIGLSVAFFILCFRKLDIPFSVANCIWFGLVLIGGAMVIAGIQVAVGATSFWFVKSTSTFDGILVTCRNITYYPITIFGGWVQILVTFFVPYAFVSFYPAEHFLSKSGESLVYPLSLFDPVLQYATPAVGLVSFSLAYRLWTFGLTRYQSTGS